LIVAVVLLGGELLTSGFFLFWFALGAVGAAVTAVFTTSMPLQLLMFIIISGILLVFSRQLGDRMGKAKADTNVSALIGRTGVVIQEILPHQRGLVKINGEEWTCVSNDSSRIRPGALVEIESIQGVTLTVTAVNKRKVG
jgi:membrane protein implicated in regulation of membrane protease activity